MIHQPALPFTLLLITDWSLGEDELLSRVDSALTAGPGLAVQHRYPEATTRVFFELGLRLRDVCVRRAAPLFVNARLDVALALGAHLHLPAHALRVKDVRPFLPPGRLLSAAVHDEREAAEAAGADVALVSPVFAPSSKPTDARPQLGVGGFRALAAKVPCPAFALGGIDERAARTLRPVAGVAVISSVLRAPEPAVAAAALLDALRP